MATATLWDTATRVGHLAWYSRQLSSLLGAWARDDRTPALARMFATMSNQHAELAASCTARLPTVTIADGSTWGPERFVAAPDLADEQLLLRSADATSAELRRRAAERLLTLAYDWAVEQGTLVDKLLDEPTADLLDTLIARIETHLLAVAGAASTT
ncbi:MAG: hypothetical protein M3337_05495 [Actinomycetota bacterium]|nr:hypothetical protein [Actinomycetota bacterium]